MKSTIADNTWVTCPKPNPQARLRLFVFPYAGSAASAFRTWSEYLPSHVEVCPIQLPGRETRIREPLCTDVPSVVGTLAQVLSPCMEIPFLFYGHSLGTLISFELARLLRRLRRPKPLHLFVSGRCAPHVPDPEPPLHCLSEGRFIEGLRRYNGTPDAVLQNKDLMDFLLPILRADFTMSETYTYHSEPPLDIPITAFGGLEEQILTREHVASWQEQTNSTFRMQMFPGDHFFIHDCRDDLLKRVSQDLNEIQTRFVL